MDLSRNCFVLDNWYNIIWLSVVGYENIVVVL